MAAGLPAALLGRYQLPEITTAVVDRFRDELHDQAETIRAEQARSAANESARPLMEAVTDERRRTYRRRRAQIGHTDPQFTFSVYQQVATRRYIDEQAIWAVMRFADEPAERAPSRQLSRLEPDDPRDRPVIEQDRFDQFLAKLNDPRKD